MFDDLREELRRITAVAWDGYRNSRKAPITQKAGPGYADPDYDLAVEWVAAKAAIDKALLICQITYFFQKKSI